MSLNATSQIIYGLETASRNRPCSVDISSSLLVCIYYISQSRLVKENATNSSPGIFMGAIALFMFLTVLYIALSALLSLKVSYASFEKDTAPGSQAQKKQQ